MVIQRNAGGVTLITTNGATVNNTLRKCFTIEVTNVTSSAIAYKVNTGNAKVYHHKNNEGVLACGKTAMVDYDLKGNSTFEDFLNAGDPLTFIVRAISYPERQEFEQATWEKLEKLPSTDMHMVTMEFQANDFGIPERSKLQRQDSVPSTNRPPPLQRQDSVPSTLNPMGSTWASAGPSVNMMGPPGTMMATPGGMMGPPGAPFMWPEQRGQLQSMSPMVMTRPPVFPKPNRGDQSPAPALTNQALITVYPMKVELKPPYLPTNTISVNIRNVTTGSSVAYKVQSNAATWKMLNAVPSKGVLSAGRSDSVQIFVNEAMSDQQILNDDHAHFFQVHALVWPSRLSEFDADLFTNLQATKKGGGELQVVAVAINIEKPTGDKGFDDDMLDTPSVIMQHIRNQQQQNQDEKPAEKDEKPEEKPPERREKAEKPSRKVDKLDKEDKSTEKKTAPAKKAPAPSKVEKCSNVEMSTTRVTYKPPYGKRAQGVMVACKNITDKPVAYKVQTTKKVFYIIKPHLGALNPNEAMHIEFEMQPALTEAELKKNVGDHLFLLTAYGNWKGDMKKINTALLKTLEAKRPETIQRVSIDIAHQGFEVTKPSKSKTPAVSPQSTQKEKKGGKSGKTPSSSPQSTPKKGGKTPSSSPPEGTPKKGGKTPSSSPPAGTPKKGGKTPSSPPAGTPKKDGKTPATSPKSTKQKSGAKKFVMVQPSKITFKGPYDGKSKLEIVTVANKNQSTVAFKIQCNKPQYYIASPTKGILPAGKSANIDIELNSTFTAADLNSKEQHKFVLMVGVWPKSAGSSFDADVWAKLDRDELQVLPLPVNIIP